MQEADRDRLDSLAAEVLDDRRQAGEVEGLSLAAVVSEAAGHLAAQVPRDERRRLDVVEVEVVGAVPACDLERVAEARSS